VTNEMTYAAPDGRRLIFTMCHTQSAQPDGGVSVPDTKDEAVILNLTIEEGLKLVLSAGSSWPGELTGRSQQKRASPWHDGDKLSTSLSRAAWFRRSGKHCVPRPLDCS